MYIKKKKSCSFQLQSVNIDLWKLKRPPREVSQNGDSGKSFCIIQYMRKWIVHQKYC